MKKKILKFDILWTENIFKHLYFYILTYRLEEDVEKEKIIYFEICSQQPNESEHSESGREIDSRPKMWV